MVREIIHKYMNYKFKITDEKFDEALTVMHKNGARIWDDGSFKISGVSGRYARADGEISITITDKPWLASWGMIKRKLNHFFN